MKCDWRAFEYASHEFKRYPEKVLEAVHQNGNVLKHISGDLKKEYMFMVEAASHNMQAHNYVKKQHWANTHAYHKTMYEAGEIAKIDNEKKAAKARCVSREKKQVVSEKEHPRRVSEVIRYPRGLGGERNNRVGVTISSYLSAKEALSCMNVNKSSLFSGSAELNATINLTRTSNSCL